jgi:2-aminoadipate transaminase
VNKICYIGLVEKAMIPVQLQPESHVPLYVQLRDQLRAMISAGELRPGERIPASRAMAAQLGVHRTTIANAYAELAAEGLISGHVGRGTFVAEAAAGSVAAGSPAVVPQRGKQAGLRWEALFADERGEEALNRLLPAAPADAISFAVARPPEAFFPLADFRRCCNAALRREGERILQLGSSDGYAPLKQALLAWLESEGVHANERQLLITDGCQQALDLLAKAFLRPGDTIVLENPTYPGSITMLDGARVRAVPVPVDLAAGGIDLDALELALRQNRIKLIFVIPDFHNPTGVTMPLAGRRRLLELAARYEVPVVEDHIYARVRLRGSPVPSLKSLDAAGLVIQIDSFSKVAFPGLRVGWCLAPESVIERMRLIKQATDLHTSQLAQATLAEFLRRGCLERHLARMRRLYLRRLEAAEQALARHMPEGVRWTRPEGGMSLWVSLPAGFDSAELLGEARERGVLYAPGRYFYLSAPEPNTLRLGFAALEERKIARGIARLAELVRARERWQRRRQRPESPAGLRVALV